MRHALFFLVIFATISEIGIFAYTLIYRRKRLNVILDSYDDLCRALICEKIDLKKEWDQILMDVYDLKMDKLKTELLPIKVGHALKGDGTEASIATFFSLNLLISGSLTYLATWLEIKPPQFLMIFVTVTWAVYRVSMWTSDWLARNEVIAENEIRVRRCAEIRKWTSIAFAGISFIISATFTYFVFK